MNDETCQHCAFFVEASTRNHGICKLSPPVFVGHNDKGFPMFYNPTVSLNSFCREWEEK